MFKKEIKHVPKFDRQLLGEIERVKICVQILKNVNKD